jgi:acyl-CoA synthetase (AMP-forming)/AMP-acid ligase II
VDFKLMNAPVVLDGSSAPPTLGDILRVNGVVHADRVALSFEGVNTTYSQLLGASNRVANALRAEGLGRGDRVAILTKNGLSFFEIFFGAAMLGVVLVPVNWREMGRSGQCCNRERCRVCSQRRRFAELDPREARRLQSPQGISFRHRASQEFLGKGAPPAVA